MGKTGVKQRQHEGEKAEQLGITRMTLNRYRTGKRAMTPEFKRKLKEIDREFRLKARKDNNGR